MEWGDPTSGVETAGKGYDVMRECRGTWDRVARRLDDNVKRTEAVSCPSPLRVPAIVSRLFPVASSLRPNRVAAPPAGKEWGVTESDEKTRGRSYHLHARLIPCRHRPSSSTTRRLSSARGSFTRASLTSHSPPSAPRSEESGEWWRAVGMTRGDQTRRL